MADFDAPSFSLGLDCDLLDLERQIGSANQDRDPYSWNQSSIAAATVKDDDFETLIVDDSEPEYPDPHPKRLRRLLTISTNTKVELHSRAVVDVLSSQEDRRTDERICTQQPAVCTSSKLPPDSQNRKQIVSNGHELNISSLRGFQLIDSDTDEPSVNDAKDMQCNAHRYFFHDDSRIQELVRYRLPNFSPLGNRDIDHQPCTTSKIDYMGQFSHGESSDRKIKDKKSSSSRQNSKRSKIEEVSQGWVNPRLGVDKGVTKGTTKRKARAVRQTAGHWLTGRDGKKVYVSKKGEELSGRVAYRQYREESGAGFKKAKKRKSATK